MKVCICKIKNFTYLNLFPDSCVLDKILNDDPIDIGYYAKNTLQDLRRQSFRNVEENGSVLTSTPQFRRFITEKESHQIVSRKPKKRTRKKKSILSSNSSNLAVVTKDVYQSKEVALNTLKSVGLWKDQAYQYDCLLNLRNILSKNDLTSHFYYTKLVDEVRNTLQLPPTSPIPLSANMIPRIIFDENGEPRVEMYFQSPNSPLISSEVIKDSKELLLLQSKIYSMLYCYSLKNDCSGLYPRPILNCERTGNSLQLSFGRSSEVANRTQSALALDPRTTSLNRMFIEPLPIPPVSCISDGQLKKKMDKKQKENSNKGQVASCCITRRITRSMSRSASRPPKKCCCC